MPVRPEMSDGALVLDGRARLLIAGEYPYYRDEPRLWECKLRAIRESGIEVVSFYVPWRHHEISAGSWAFRGPGNRDLVGFLEAVAAAGLLALAKPGPFVHAELPLGGLPDRVSPSFDPVRQPAVSASGTVLRSQRHALPSPHDSRFVADAGEWLEAVGSALHPHLWPGGPVVAVQVGNEGNVGETALPIDALDYSPAGVAAFSRFAGAIEPPHAWTEPQAPQELEAYLAWAAWSGESLARSLDGSAARLGLDVPLLVNLSPPPREDRDPASAAGRYDAWLAREVPTRENGLHYAYTSWVGNAATDDEALVNYVLAAKRRRGPNLEENWSLRWVDPACAAPAVPVFHALLGIACGATGLDVYTTCATTSWGDHLVIDRGWLGERMGNPLVFDPPYGDAAPIDSDGAPGPSMPALRTLIRYLAAEAERLVACSPEPGVAWGYHGPSTALGAWQPTANSALPSFVLTCLQRGIPFTLENLEDVKELEDQGTRGWGTTPLALVSGPFMAAEVQGRLARFVLDGGSLLLVDNPPHLDDRFQPCCLLADALARAGCGRATMQEWLASVPGARSAVPDAAHLQLRLVGDRDRFVFAFNRADEPFRLETDVDGGELAIDLAPRGCAVVRIGEGRLRSCYVKGVNELLGTGAAVRVAFGDDVIASAAACDLVVTGR
jgi:beta-galactosidase